MKTVKILSLTLLMSVFCAGMTFAQQQGQRTQRTKANSEERASKQTAEERASKQVEMMKKSLNLTSEQVTKMQALQTQFNKDQEQSRTASKDNHQDMKAKRDAYDSQVKSILTPEQYQKYQDQRANMTKKGDQQGKENREAKDDHKGKWSKDKKEVDQTQKK
jgi:Spy/CpxP family protein refolding chaperone